MPVDPNIAAVNIRKFTERAAAYGQGADRPELAVIAELAGDLRGKSLLDTAGGKGACALAMAGRGARVVLADLTEAMLAAAKAGFLEAGVTFSAVAADTQRLPFANRTFDAVTCTRAFHHVADVPAALTEVRRVLKPGGLLLVADHSGPNRPASIRFLNELERTRDGSHVRMFSPHEWRSLLAQAGFLLRGMRRFETRLDVNAFVEAAGEAAGRVRKLIETAPPAALADLQFDLSDPPEFVRAEVVFAAALAP